MLQPIRVFLRIDILLICKQLYLVTHRIPGVVYQPERLTLPEGDFVNLLEMPCLGGHVGFMAPRSLFTYAERRALAFALDVGK